MNTIRKLFFWAVVPLIASLAWAEQPTTKNSAEPKKNQQGALSVTIASGNIDGIYYPTAGAICLALKKTYNEEGIQQIHCNVEPSEGSVNNLTELLNQEVELGIAQSDTVRKAWEGSLPFQTASKQLRSVLSLYSETLTIISLKKTGINTLADLKGKRINLGIPGSSSEQTSHELLTACGFKPNDTTLTTLSQSDAAQALKKNEIDAYLNIVGHPNESVWNLASTEAISILPLTDACLQSVLAKSRLYVKAIIPANIYPGIDTDIESLGVKATLMTTADADEGLIYTTTKAIIEKLYRFKRIHPDFAIPNPKTLFEGLIAPLHLGAFRYFQELRLLEFKNSGTDIMSSLPNLIDQNGFQIALNFTEQAPDALLASNVLIGEKTLQEAGIPLTTSSALSMDGVIFWLTNNSL